MTIALDSSRPPRKHLRLVSIGKPNRVLTFRDGHRRSAMVRRHAWAFLCAALAMAGILGLMAGGWAESGWTIMSTVHDDAPTFRDAPSFPVHASMPSRQSMHIRNCAEARALGLAPIYRGQSGYAAHLDRDGDGIACEPYRGR
jgi:Excalibur calcium-binding domain